MKKLMLSAALLALLIGLIFLSGYILRPLASDVYTDQVRAFHALPENSTELIAYGSSHCWNGFDSAQFQRDTGLSAYNYACDWQKLNTTMLFFQDSLKTQSPRLALVETLNIGSAFVGNATMDAELNYTRALGPSAERREYLRQCFGTNLEAYLSYYVPLVAFHGNWEQLETRSFFRGGTDLSAFLDTRGFQPKEEVVPAVLEYAEKDQEPLPAECIAILDHMTALARERDVTLVFFTVPYAYRGTFNYAAAMRDYAVENDCYYINLFDYLDELEMDGNTDFSDVGHLNTTGATKVTAFMTRYLRETGLLSLSD